MKTRNSLVSNSSSSSFVVAFPRKPKSAKDVLEFMFKGKDGGLSVYDNDGLSYQQISENIFNDLTGKDCKKATIKTIAEQFESRLIYDVNSRNSFWDGKKQDSDGGSWYYPITKYCGSDPVLLEKLRKEFIKQENESKKLRAEENEIMKRGPKHPGFHAFKGGTDYNTKKLYTKEQIAASEKYEKELQKFKDTDKQYLDYSERYKKFYSLSHIETDNLRTELSMKDARAFLDDNKGNFIFIISYSDNDGETGCTMEHGDIFRNVPHETINNH